MEGRTGEVPKGMCHLNLQCKCRVSVGTSVRYMKSATIEIWLR